MKLWTKEWTTEQHLKVDTAILKHFGGKRFLNHRGKYVFFPHDAERIEDILGLPYTSTSMCPMVTLDCNVEILYDDIDFHYDFVALNQWGKVVFALVDEEKNRTYIKA